jgi:hypothetical protein
VPVITADIDRAAPNETAKPTHPTDGAIDNRVQEIIDKLKGESNADSLARLHYVNQFYWPGPISEGGVFVGFPLPHHVGNTDVEAILSNRRVLKLLHEFSLMPRDKAARLLDEQIRDASLSYTRNFEDYFSAALPVLKPADESKKIGLSFETYTPDEKTPTLAGFKLRLLALVFIAGQLELTETRTTVLAVIGDAVRQYQKLSEHGQFNLGAAYSFQVYGSAYSRPVLIAALARLSPKELPDQELTQLGLKWRTQKLTMFDARVTPHDLHGRVGARAVDYSKGSQNVRFLLNVSDEQFTRCVELAGGLPTTPFRPMP